MAKVDRLEGATRYHTAGAIAEAQNDCEDNVTIVSGQNFPDALAASYYGDPILLVEPNAVPAATKAALDDLGAKNVRIVGGTQAVSAWGGHHPAGLQRGHLWRQHRCRQARGQPGRRRHPLQHGARRGHQRTRRWHLDNGLSFTGGCTRREDRPRGLGPELPGRPRRRDAGVERRRPGRLRQWRGSR